MSKYDSHVVTVKLNSPNQEAREYGSKLFNALRKTDWEVKIIETQDPPGSPGLCIHEQGVDAKPNNPKNDPKKILEEGLRYAKIMENCGGASAKGDYQIFLLVGSRPLAIRDDPWKTRFIRFLKKSIT